MGKALLLIVSAALAGTGLVMFSGLQKSVYHADEEFSEHSARVMARQLAQTGLSEARAEVLGDPASVTSVREFRGEHLGGTYRSTVTPNPEGTSLTLRIDSRMPLGGDRGSVSHTIETVYTLVPGGESGDSSGGSGTTTVILPPFMRAAITTNQRVNGNNLTVSSTDPDVNANIHINQSPNDLNNSRVNGFLYYHAQNLDQGIRSRLSSVFRPNVNPDGLPVIQHREQAIVPQLNAGSFQNRPGVTTWPQNQAFRGDINLGGSPGSPAIWFVNGELSTQQAVTFHGYAVLIVRNNVNINHAVTTSPNSQIALYTGSGFNFNASMNIRGLLFANGNIPLNNATIRGRIIARGDVNANGTTNVIYESTPGDLVSPVFEVEEIVEPGDSTEAVWRTTRYREWAAQHEAGD